MEFFYQKEERWQLVLSGILQAPRKYYQDYSGVHKITLLMQIRPEKGML